MGVPIQCAEPPKKYVWYVGYGSNLKSERFDCYIKGGTPKYATKADPGSRDPAPPRTWAKTSIPYQLYFAERSKNWGGAVAFIGHEATPKTPTIGRMYLITEEQFYDVVKQENGLLPVAGMRNLIDLREVIAKTKVTFLHGKDNWYGTIVYLGEQDGYPKYTFTASREYGNYNPPSEGYLKTIVHGLRELGDVSTQQAAEYLMQAPGVDRNFTVERIKVLYHQQW
jgi:hypothetical protein